MVKFHYHKTSTSLLNYYNAVAGSTNCYCYVCNNGSGNYLDVLSCIV
jgi:hypothetical protein